MTKAIIIAAMAALTSFNAQAQSKTNADPCGKSNGKVCKIDPVTKKESCYKSKFDQNYKVTKGPDGYFIACEAPGYAQTPANNGYNYRIIQDVDQDMNRPRITSAINANTGNYQCYYSKNGLGNIKVCFVQ
jgi:hypothetical protein